MLLVGAVAVAGAGAVAVAVLAVVVVVLLKALLVFRRGQKTVAERSSSLLTSLIPLRTSCLQSNISPLRIRFSDGVVSYVWNAESWGSHNRTP